MPHFTREVSPNGPIVGVIFAASEARRAALTAAGKAHPNPVPGVALLDTGASCTCIDPAIARQLELSPTGTTGILTPSTGATQHETEQFDIAMVIPGPDGAMPLVLQTVPVVSCELYQTQEIHALIGRDILNRCVFVYNGAGFFTLAF